MPPSLDSFGALVLGVSAFFVGFTAVGLALGFLLERLLAERRIWSDRVPAGQLRHELVGNAMFLSVIIASFTAALGAGAFRFGPPSAMRDVATFVGMNIGFQAYFYALHRSLHHPSLVALHRWHHVSRITTPLSGQSMSVGEALGWAVGYVALPALASQLTPLGFSGFVAYVAYNVVGNIVGHANVEPVPNAPGLRLRSLVATVFTYHALHHLRWTGHFGFASSWADRLFGTEWPDWMRLHARVAAGQPLTLAKTRRIEQDVR